MSEPTEKPTPEPQPEQESLDYESETLEQLEERFAKGEGLITERDDEPPPEPPAEPPAESDAPEPEHKAEEAEAEALPTEEPPPEPETDERALELEELRLRYKQLELQRAKDQDIASRNAGMVGHLKKQLESLSQQPPARPPLPEDDYQAEPPQYQQPPAAVAHDPELQTRLAELEQTERGRAIQEEYAEFVQSLHRDMAARADGRKDFDANAETEKLLTEIAPLINEEIESYKDVAMTAKSTRKVAKLVLESAHNRVQLARIEKMRAEAKNRKATQTTRIQKDKQAAAPAGSGSTPGAKPRQKSPEEMTAEEADAALIAEFGDGHYGRGRAR